MSHFISTINGKIINVENIAFLTTRSNPKATHRGPSEDGKSTVNYHVPGVPPIQLVVAFAASTQSQSGVLPLSIVMEGQEATNFLDQLQPHGIDVRTIRAKVETPPVA